MAANGLIQMIPEDWLVRLHHESDSGSLLAPWDGDNGLLAHLNANGGIRDVRLR